MKRTVVFAALVMLIAAHGVGAMAQSIQNVAQDRDALVRLLKDRQIARLEILHVSDLLETRTQITPDTLRTLSKHKVVIDDPEQSETFSRLLTALEELGKGPVAKAGEVRWAILFFDRAGKERYAVFLGRDGMSGRFENVPLSLQGKLLGWARETIQRAFLPVRPMK